MKVRLGCQPLTWGADFETATREIAAIGYKGIEPWVDNHLDEIPQLAALLDKYHLQATGTYVACRFHEEEHAEEEIRRVVEIASKLRAIPCERIILAASGRPQEGRSPDEVYERFADGCNEAARQCAEKHGIETVFHNHAWTLIESPEEIDLLCQFTDPQLVYMAFDTAQILYGGGDPAAVFSKHIDRVRYVHLKDLNPELAQYPTIVEKNAHRPQHVFVELGKGCLGDNGLETVLEVLRQANYAGWITGELDSTPLTPREGNENNFRWLNQHLGVEELVGWESDP